MAHHNIEQISLRQFGETLRRGEWGQRAPISGTFELTMRCNLDCVHCYGRLPVDDEQSQCRELCFSEVCALLDDAAQAGCLWLLFTGGEPLVRPDFVDIYTYAKEKGFLITLIYKKPIFMVHFNIMLWSVDYLLFHVRTKARRKLLAF